MKMRELESKTGVNRETIRVYFRLGILPEPLRPKPNVADYDESHVQAIQVVRALQSESGLTLVQIRDAMDGRPPPRRVEAGAFQHLEQLLAARLKYEKRLMPVRQVLERYPHAESDARELAEMDMLTLIEGSDGPMLDLSDLRLVEIWGEMRKAGFVEAVGFRPETIRFYKQAAEFVAANEARAFLERTQGRIDDSEAVSMLQTAVPAMLDFFGLLRLKAFMQAIQEGTQDPPDGKGASSGIKLPASAPRPRSSRSRPPAKGARRR